MSIREAVAKAIYEATYPGWSWEQLNASALEEWGAIADAAIAAMRSTDWRPSTGSAEDDLRSRLACVLEATYWDRPYDERLAAIRGMCDLTTNGLTPADG